MSLLGSITSPSYFYTPPSGGSSASNETNSSTRPTVNQAESSPSSGSSDSSSTPNHAPPANTSVVSEGGRSYGTSSAPAASVQSSGASSEYVQTEAQLLADAPSGGFSNQEDLFSALFDLGVIGSADWGMAPEAPNANENILVQLYASSKLGDEAPQSFERKA